MDNHWILFDDFKNTKVRHADQDKSGEVSNVVLDIQTGRIAFYTLSNGGFMGMGDEKVALPPDAIHLSGREGRLQVAEERIRKAPGTGTDWPERVDSTFIDDVYRYYGYKPFSAG